MNRLLPWKRRSQPLDPFDDFDDEGFFVFVPAIMSVGLVFSVITLVRDAFRWTGSRARQRRTAIEARTVVNDLLGEIEREPTRSGLLKRSVYVFAGATFVGAALYIAIGSTVNYLKPDGYVHDIGWLLALAWSVAALLAFLGVVALAVAQTWPHPPAWASRTLRTAPLSINPNRVGQGPPLWMTVATLVGALATMIITLMVITGRALSKSIDQPLVDWLSDKAWLDNLGVVDPFGSTLVTIALVTLIGLGGFRCRVMAVVYPAAFAVAWLTIEILQHTTDRPRPSGYGGFESFPSGHMVQVVFIAGLLPLALRALFGSRRLVSISRVLLGIAVAATAVHRVYLAKHWPMDVLGGLGLGLTVVFAAHWVLEHRTWHQGCDNCPWSESPESVEWEQGLISLPSAAARRVGQVGVGAALLAAAGLGIATLTVGLPTDPEGSGLGSAISQPVQLALAALLAISGLIATRFRAVAAFLMAVAAMGLGVFASIEYVPQIAFGLAVVLMIPAVLTWFSWQPTATLGSIAALAALTASALTGTGLGVREVHEHYFGPSHPESIVSGLESSADWLWLGAVTDTTATVSAGGLAPGSAPVVDFWPTGSRDQTRSVVAEVPRDGVAQFELLDLQPATSYSYRVDDGGEEAVAIVADFRTFASGPQDLHIALGSCARRGSNGAVFDSIVDQDPDLYLALGDLHYGNLSSTDPAVHVSELGRAVGRPAQSQLFRSVPTAYVWDDHDFGPNDADSTSPARQAVSQAYRAAVPNYSVDPDPAASIAQAFSIGRVRFIMTDTRSHRTASTMLGPDQLAWFLDEITASAADHALVVWANPTPWIGARTSGGDAWSSYPDERRQISNAIANANIDNLLMVSGDAHMVAIDDGTNSDYSESGGGGFPVLHAAALDRPGSVKGGPYSHGAFPGGGQYAMLDVIDDGTDQITVTMSGYRWDDTPLVDYTFTVEVDPPSTP